jgi:hypothetical protein
MSWQSDFTSQFQLILWTEGPNTTQKVSHLVRPHQSFHLYANTRMRYPQPVTTLFLPPTHSPPTDYPTVPAVHNPSPLQSVTQAPSNIRTEIHPNMHQGHKTQPLPYLFPHLPTPFSDFHFIATFTNCPICTTSLIQLCSQLPLFKDIIIKGFSI